MKKKYLILKFVNKNHSLFLRYLFGIGSFLSSLICTKSIACAKLSFSDFYKDDFKLGIRRALKFLNIFWGITIVKDETFNFCEDMNFDVINVIKKKFNDGILNQGDYKMKGQYFYVLSWLLEFDKNKGTKVIDEFNKYGQEIINLGNYIYSNEEKVNSCLKKKESKKRQRKGDFVITEAIKALYDWSIIFPKNKYKWFVISGTFLGLIREGGFLKHDYDIDIGIDNESYKHNEMIRKISNSKKFYIRKIDFLKEGFFKNGKYITKAKKIVLIKLIHKSGLNIDLFIHYREDNLYWHGSSFHRWDNHIFNLKEYNIHGIDVLGPENFDLYLTENYGDWRTPVKDFHFNTGTPNLSINTNPSSVAMFLKRMSEFRSAESFLKNKYILKRLNILSDDAIFDIRNIKYNLN